MAEDKYRTLKHDDDDDDSAGDTRLTAVDDAISEARATSTVSIFFHEARHIEKQRELASIIDTYRRFHLKIDSSPQDTKVWKLCSIERCLTATPGFPREVLSWFASAVDSVFPPVPEATILEMCEDLKRLQESKFGSTPAALRAWGVAKRFAGEEEEPAMFASERESLIVHVTSCLRDTLDKFKGSPMLCWFLSGLLQAASLGRYEFLGAHGLVPTQAHVRRKQKLQWTIFGLIASQLVSKGFCRAEDFQTTSFVDMFEELDAVTMPAFMHRLAILEGVMMSQDAAVTRYKAKIMAVVVTLAMTAGHMVAACAVEFYTGMLRVNESGGEGGH